jgi:hypothetical protein
MEDRVESARETTNADLEIPQFWFRYRFQGIFVDVFRVVDFSCHFWCSGSMVSKLMDAGCELLGSS